jgi:hypothetical protein
MVEVAVVAQKKTPEPPLVFEAREGVGVAIVAQKRILESLTHICSEGGGCCCCCPVIVVVIS